MDAIKFPIGLTTAVLIIYVFFSQMNVPYSWVMSLFLLVNGLFIWMIIRILKDGNPSEKSFDDYFYEDFEEKRN